MVRFVVSCMSQILSNGFVILDILAIFWLYLWIMISIMRHKCMLGIPRL